MEIGARVVRGPDWSSGEIDGGEGHLGTVVSLGGETTCEVLWDNGKRCICRIGTSGKHDLRVFDTGPAGNRQSGTCCNECGVSDICGTVWRCKTCDISLCCLCYGDMKHDITHLFRRFDTCTSKGVDVSSRCSSLRVQALGLFSGATVIKGSNWNEEEAASVTEGKIISVEDHPSGASVRSMVRVEWGEEETGVYRAGHEGKMDVQCVTEYPGTFYYREHLGLLRRGFEDAPPVSTETPRLLRSGDRVCIKVSLVRLQEMQRQAQLSDHGLQELVKKFGTVKSYTNDGHVTTSFKGHVTVIPEEALKKVPLLTEGDTVRICSDLEELKLLQEGHGGFQDGMTQTLGKVGMVEDVNSDGNVDVLFGSVGYQYNPACCNPATGIQIDVLTSNLPDETESVRQVDAEEGQAATDAMLQEKAEGMFDAFVKGNYSQCLKIMKLDPRLKDIVVRGTTLFLQACLNGCNDFVKQLLHEGVDINKQDDNGNTAILVAVVRNDCVLAGLLVDNGCNVNILCHGGANGLHMCVQTKNIDMARILVKGRPDVNMKDKEENTPLHVTVETSQNEMLTLLLSSSQNIDPTVTNSRGFNILQLAALRNNYRALETLLAKFPEIIDEQMAVGKFTALHIAARNDHADCVKILLDKGKANINAKNVDALTPLHLSSIELYESSIAILLQRGADVNAQDHKGNTALHLVIAGNALRNAMQDSLLPKSVEDETRIRLACKLLKSGARSDLRNMAGLTPLEAAPSDTVKTAVTMFIRSQSGQTQSSTSSTTSSSQVQSRDKSILTRFCSHCLTAVVDIKLRPCGHRFLCRKCVDLVEHCPFCKQLIQGFESIHPNGAEDSTKVNRKTLCAFRSGDRVCIKVSLVRLQEMQRRAQLSDQGLQEVMGKFGRINSSSTSGYVTVTFGSQDVVISEEALIKVPLLTEGDTVRICSDKEEVKLLQEGHGGFTDQMTQIIGKVGVVRKVETEEDVNVVFSNTSCRFNPACCNPAPGAAVDTIPNFVSSSLQNALNSRVQMAFNSGKSTLDGQIVTDIALLEKAEGMFDAFQKGNYSLCLIIMRLDPRLKKLIHRGHSLLNQACFTGCTDFVRQLLDEGIDINQQDAMKCTAILMAVVANQQEIAKLLVDRGCDVNVGNEIGSVEQRSVAMARILFRGNVDINTQDIIGNTPVHVAVERSDEMLMLLLTLSTNLDPTVTNHDGLNILQLAAVRARHTAVEMIVAKFPGAVDARMAEHDFTALHIAANNNHIECVRALIDKGKADINAKSRKGWTPLHLVCQRLYDRIITFLIERGADVNTQDNEGNTPLHFVMECQISVFDTQVLGSVPQQASDGEIRIQLACKLLKSGARMNIRNNKGQTALEIVQSERVKKSVTMFISGQSTATSSSTSSDTQDETSEVSTPGLPCSHCLTTLVDIKLMPCGHKLLCRNCWDTVHTCPFCNQTIEGVEDTQTIQDQTETSEDSRQNCKVQ